MTKKYAKLLSRQRVKVKRNCLSQLLDIFLGIFSVPVYFSPLPCLNTYRASFWFDTNNLYRPTGYNFKIKVVFLSLNIVFALANS